MFTQDPAEGNNLAQIANQLVAGGFSPLPIAPKQLNNLNIKGKSPGKYDGCRWHNMIGWQRFCDVPTTPREIEQWASWPYAGLGLACGFNDLVGIDLDFTDRDALFAVQAVLPELVSGKRGKKGATWLFQGPGIAASKIKSAGRSIVDVLGHGNQTVLPPTIHPDTGKPYAWIGKPLHELLTADLSVITTDHIAAIRRVLIEHGYVLDQEHPKRQGSAQASDHPWALLNGKAMDCIDLWMAALKAEGAPFKRTGVNHWRGPAVWRSGGNDTAVSVMPKGIRDFGIEEGYSPLDFIGEVRSTNIGLAFEWLEGVIGPADAPFDEEALFGPGGLAEFIRRSEEARAAPIGAPILAPTVKRQRVPLFNAGALAENRRATVLLLDNVEEAAAFAPLAEATGWFATAPRGALRNADLTPLAGHTVILGNDRHMRRLHRAGAFPLLFNLPLTGRFVVEEGQFAPRPVPNANTETDDAVANEKELTDV